MEDNLHSTSLRSIRTVEEGSIAQSRMDQPNTSDDSADLDNLVPFAAYDDSQTKTTYMDAGLYTATLKGNISKLEQMLEACDLGLQLTPKRNTILHIAAQFAREGHLTVVQALIQAAKALPDEIESGVGVDKVILRMANEGKDTALHEAVRYHHPEVVKLLIEEDPQFTYGPNISGGTPLYMAVERGHGNLVQIIIDNTSTSPAYSGILGRTALHAAVIRNDQEITTKLLEWKPSLIKEVDENGWSPFTQLLHKSPDKSVAYLGIKRGKQTALLIAAKRGHKDIVDLLLSYSPDCCEQVDDNGKNVLHFAMMNKQDYYPGICSRRHALHLLASYLVDDEEFVLDDRVDKMPLNNENLTPKDIVSRVNDRWLQKKYFLDFFSKSEEVGIGPLSWVPGDKKDNDSSESKDSKDNSISKLKKTGEIHLIVAALVATVTFAAGFTLPGGYNENDGKAILAKKAAFKAFVVTDTLAMVFSVSATFVYFYMAIHEKVEYLEKHYVWGCLLTMLGMGSMVVAFMTGMYAVLPHFSGLPIVVCVLCCCFFLFFYYLFRQLQKG
ncbi:hypothetical protein AAG906_039699 [Vitis piasezkii]